MTGTTSAPAPSPYRVRARNIAPDSDNKIHDDDVARQFGFDGALVPGVELFAYLSHPLVAAWGVEFLTAGRLDVRFRKPVYDGEELVCDARPAGDGSFTVILAGPDGEPRSVGQAWAPGTAPPVSRTDVTDTPPRDRLLPTGPDPLPLGPMGSVSEPVEPAAHADYLDAIGEKLALYRDENLVHPGALLRVVNALLMRNVALGPWVHTASAGRFLAAARVPCELRAHGVITDCYERNGHSWVRYDAVVVSDGVPVLEVGHTAIYRVAGDTG